MIINKTVYPDVSVGTYTTVSNPVMDYDPDQELEHSIFYAGSVSENVQWCDETNYTYTATAPDCHFSVTPKDIVKGDVFFLSRGFRFFNLNDSWQYRNDQTYNIVTEFDISKFYFDMNQLTCQIYDLSNPDGGHAIGSASNMAFNTYRSQTADYKKTHLIRSVTCNYVYGDSTSFCKYKDVANYYDVNVSPMIRYKFNDKTTIYAPVILNSYGIPDWQGPSNLNTLTGSGDFPSASSDIYSNTYTYFGKWYDTFTPGGPAHLVTAANCGASSLSVHAANDQGQQVNNGYHIPDRTGINTDKYMIPVFVWGNSWNKRIVPFFTDEFLMRYIASFGLRFLVDSTMYIGYMNSDGTCNGDYILEADLPTSDSANRNITDFSGSNYDANVPYVPPSPGTDEDEDTAISTNGAPFGTGLAHYYVTTVDSVTLQHISEAMGTWDIDATKKDLYRNLISCKLMKPPAGIPSDPSGVFTIYGVKPQYNGADITITEVTGNPSITYGPYSIDRKFNDFRDYAPYSKAEIFVPYCGWTALPSHVIGRSVYVDYFTDVIAGTVKAVIRCGNNVVAEAAGVMAVDIPFASENVGAKVAAATTGMLSYGQGALQASVGIGQAVASKGKAGIKNITSGLASVIGAYNQMAMVNNENWTEINGKSGDGCALAGIDTIIIKITRPKYGSYPAPYYVPADYGHTVGFVSMKKTKVGSCTGLIICDNVDTSGISGATDRERQLIKEYLESGVIVNHPE